MILEPLDLQVHGGGEGSFGMGWMNLLFSMKSEK
jgi:hypothetical protein